MRSSIKRCVMAALLAVVMLLGGLIGCKNAGDGICILYEENGLKIAREGATLRVYDLVGHASYSFTAHRTRAKIGSHEGPKTARTAVNTPTIMIQTVYDLVVVTMKDGGDPLYFLVRG